MLLDERVRTALCAAILATRKNHLFVITFLPSYNHFSIDSRQKRWVTPSAYPTYRAVRRGAVERIHNKAVESEQSGDYEKATKVLKEGVELHSDCDLLQSQLIQISTSNPAYAEALQRGAELLRQVGYPGF